MTLYLGVSTIVLILKPRHKEMPESLVKQLTEHVTITYFNSFFCSKESKLDASIFSSSTSSDSISMSGCWESCESNSVECLQNMSLRIDIFLSFKGASSTKAFTNEGSILQESKVKHLYFIVQASSN